MPSKIHATALLLSCSGLVLLIIGRGNFASITKTNTQTFTAPYKPKPQPPADDTQDDNDVPKRGDWRVHFERQEASVLITGVAGFIGAHVAIRLRELGHDVIGIDNMNNYYDVRLKLARKSLVERAGANFITGDLCDVDLVRKLLNTSVITHVLHFAAQAGVRYSRQNPLAYGQANVMCTINLLEEARKLKKPPVVLYASSSSVYGKAKHIPFSESQPTHKPISLYAATKKATEHIAHAYHSLYHMRMTGLRFFTVYGPLGRPDMAAWMWAKNITEGQPLTLYRTHGALLRDFTYIDDIVDGVVRAMDYSADWAIFNLGRGEPQNVTELINSLEEQLEKTAIVKLKPLPPGTVRTPDLYVATPFVLSNHI
uniref:NAD-dependent epimerase/dehydratase domain-containing protein n=1 Tax=Lotharella globosa TaxID=91324 RepID=A0A7S4DUT4_9EUKA